MDSPLGIILEMLSTLFSSTVSAMGKIFSLFGDLLASLGIVSEVGGPLGFGLSVVIIGAVGFFVAKFLFGGAVKLIILFLVVAVVAYVIILGSVL